VKAPAHATTSSNNSREPEVELGHDAQLDLNDIIRPELARNSSVHCRPAITEGRPEGFEGHELPLKYTVNPERDLIVSL
jgi:hypothetical protein